MSRLMVNGVTYNVAVKRVGSGPALVLLHGFTGSAATWAPHLPAFTRGHTVVAIDLLGHGASDAPADPSRYTMARTVDDLTAILGQLDLARAAWLGYSMGGRIALAVAAVRPDLVDALVLEGASPGIADPGERAARVQADETLAARIERDGVAAFVAGWERLPLFASQARLPDAARAVQRRQRLANNPTGLANSLRGMGAGAQPPFHDHLSAIAVPTLLIAGAEDAKFRHLAAQMAAALPNATVAIVPDAGHAAHLEQPRAFEEAVLGFLRLVEQPGERETTRVYCPHISASSAVQ